MSNSINAVKVDVLVSVLSSFNSIINEDRAVKEEAIKTANAQIASLQAQIKTCEEELSKMILSPEVEEFARGVVNSLPSTLSDGIKVSTALQCLAEHTGKQLDVVFQNAAPKGVAAEKTTSTRESKEDFRARLMSSLSHERETTVKELEVLLSKNPAQINTELNLLVQLGKASVTKREGSRTQFYKLIA